MKNILIITTDILVFLLVTSFVTLYFLNRQPRDWDFIQKVGGIKTGIPLETEDGLYLPVLCNVSGLDSITTKPTLGNSALWCLKTRTSIKGNNIHLKVVAGLSFRESDKCRCKAVKIGHLRRGIYTVYYGEKSSLDHPIGKFTVE